MATMVSHNWRCSHGEPICWSEMSAEERETADVLNDHAFTYAEQMTYDRDECEEYAAWYAAENWRENPNDWWPHEHAWPHWQTLR